MGSRTRRKTKGGTVKPESTKFIEAVRAMAALIPFFPKDEISQRIIATELEKFVNTDVELSWLTSVACGSMRDWEKGGGLPELRGIFCTRFKPADGIQQYCTTPGFRAEDREAEFFAKEREENESRYQEYKRLAGPDAKQFSLPKPKLLQ
jgi:hypothetical protein